MIKLVQRFQDSQVRSLFLVQSVIAAFCCYARPDYNFPICLLAWFVWDMEPS